MNRLIQIVTLISMACLTSVFAERDVTFKSEISVEGRFVLLKDIIIPNDKISEDELNLTVLEAPARGSKRYSPVAIAYKMQEHKKLMDLVISSPPSVKVIRVADVNFQENVKASLITQLQELPQWKKFKINLVFQADDLIAISHMSGADSFKITSQSISRNMSTTKLRVNFSEKQKPLGSITLNPQIQRELDMVYLKEPLKKGDVITRSNIQIVKSWSDGRESEYCLSEEEAVGYELRQNLPGGSKIAVNFLADPIYAMKGDIISVKLVSPGLDALVKAEAQQQARRGDIIRVKNTATGRLLTVKLVAVGVGLLNSGEN
ncbi:MAG: flagellar basal body P-ring formation chaperone FlgA [Lentisphaeraceae bacterium]|nr:flagellar basal body P-ring formation chaperone FlgA [Lentisphaeraceae bacterium]